MISVLLVDDDTGLTTLLKEYLIEEDFTVHTAEDGRTALQTISKNIIDIIVLDIMMPKMNGIELLQRIRKTSSVPVLMLTAKGDDADRIAGLNLGADDYVTKPCSPGELLARLRAIMRRVERMNSPAETLQIGNLVIHPGQRIAEWNSKPLELTGTEFNLLEVLARSAGQLISKQDISKQAFGRPLTAYDRRIDVHISSVRQKLGKRADGQSWIQSVRGQGYQLIRDKE
ncbi:response regulator transcription factor [uncultured Cohaesibacter sp.]|uniref:response regulator transcription factor n=1 Tax=uncultured Cohaesibacter sp. TaxID=1002546 RepID=UPI00292F33C9|nr:response regulator transcription factor [uncultured Cohaesibacter sp.]